MVSMEATPKSRRLFTISIRETLLAVALVGVCLGWRLDHQRYAAAAGVVNLARHVQQIDPDGNGNQENCCVVLDGNHFCVHVQKVREWSLAMSCCR
jgi:hypothetical protein